MKKRLCAGLLCLCLLAGLLPAAVFAVGTDTDIGTGKAIQFGTDGISGWDSTDGYDYIYFGYWEAQDEYTTSGPIKWRVLDDQTNTGEAGLFLLSDVLLGTGENGSVYFQQSYHQHENSDNWNIYYQGSAPADDDYTNCRFANAWQGSDAQSWCNGFYNSSLTPREQSAVLATTKSDESFSLFAASENILSGDRLFFLSAEEAENADYGFIDDAARLANYGNRVSNWWLRSPYDTPTYDRVGRVYDDSYYAGQVNYSIVWMNREYAARPAFNLDQDAVLFTSAAVGGKASGAVGADALVSVPDYSGNEWKLTLLDASRSNFSVSGASMDDGTVSFSYSGAQTGTDEYISVVVVENSEVTYYGRVLQLDGTANGASGTASLSLPEDVIAGVISGDNTKLYVFNEQYNGDQMTDYASNFVDITPTVSADGSKMELRTNDTHIQWKYQGEGDDAWRNLIALSDLQQGAQGADGREIELRVDGGYIRWRYTTGSDTEWKNLIAVSDLQGLKGDKGDKGDPGADGQDGKDGQDGADGREIELQNNGTTIQWRYVGETEWKDLVDLSVLTGSGGQDGADGTDGREVELRVDGGYIQWRYTTGSDTEWKNLIAVSALQGLKGDKGDKGDPGADGQDGLTPYIGDNGNWWIGATDTGIKAAGTDGADGQDGLTPYIGDNGNWWIGTTDTGIRAAGTDGTNGSDGKDGADGQDGKDGLTPYIGDNGNWWIGTADTGIKAVGTDGTSGVDGKGGANGKDGVDGTNGSNGQNGADGQDGVDGVGIANIEINDSGELIVTLTDGTEKNLGRVTGSDGVGIIGAAINEDGELILTLSDGTELNAGVVRTEAAVAAMATVSEQNSGRAALLYVFMGISGLSLAGLIALLIFLYTKRKVLFGK